MTAAEARDYFQRRRVLASFWPSVEEIEQKLQVKLIEVWQDDELIVLFMEGVQHLRGGK